MWNNGLWKDLTKMEMLDNNPQQDDWQTQDRAYQCKHLSPAVKHGGGVMSLFYWTATELWYLALNEMTTNFSVHKRTVASNVRPSVRQLKCSQHCNKTMIPSTASSRKENHC